MPRAAAPPSATADHTVFIVASPFFLLPSPRRKHSWPIAWGPAHFLSFGRAGGVTPGEPQAGLGDQRVDLARFDVSAAINAGYGPRKRSPTAERRRYVIQRCAKWCGRSCNMWQLTAKLCHLAIWKLPSNFEVRKVSE